MIKEDSSTRHHLLFYVSPESDALQLMKTLYELKNKDVPPQFTGLLGISAFFPFSFFIRRDCP